MIAAIYFEVDALQLRNSEVKTTKAKFITEEQQ